MKDDRLIHANAAKLDELKVLMTEQPDSAFMAPIEMADIIIEKGAVNKLVDSVKKLTAGKNVLMVTGPTEILDRNGRNVKENVKAILDSEFNVEWLVISEPDSLPHATPENAAKIQARFEGKDIVVGVGGGTICDLCKYGTYYFNPENPLPLIVVETALSVNAFSDNSSVMLINGVKRTVHSRYPTILIVDLDIQASAPAEMNASGYGDLLATWTAPVDWYLGYTLGMSKNFLTSPTEMIRTQCEELIENSAVLKGGDEKVLWDLANTLTLSGLCMGFANESSPASGSEHVMSHLIDMASRIRKTGICYHGTQVGVGSVMSSIIWDWVLNEFDPKSVDLDRCYPSAEEMEPKVRAAFDWLDEEHNASNECWSDYQKKLAKWHENKEKFKAFLDNFDEFKAHVAPWVKKPDYITNGMHTLGAPAHYSELNYPVDEKTVRWAIENCHLMRNRFSVIDLLHFSGIWNADFVSMILERAAAIGSGL